jgi:glycosyltransferase involved in cell wall biosynthesis
MKISVIIPVYNAEPYVAHAVESALQQPECGEVVLVEDGSPDNSLMVCRRLAETYDTVRLYQHENSMNKGPGPTRNFGVQKARFDFIAFLDADDFYLPDRFKKAVECFAERVELDGVYEPVGSCFENEEAKRRFFVGHSNETAMVRKRVDPEGLFECLIEGKSGYIHPDGLVLKKKAFMEVGMYPELRLHEDTMLMMKLALLCRLEAGERNNPVSMRQLHLNNTITKPGIDFLHTRCLFFDHLLQWMRENNLDKNATKLVKSRYLSHRYRLLKKNGKYPAAFFNYIEWKWLDLVLQSKRLVKLRGLN